MGRAGQGVAYVVSYLADRSPLGDAPVRLVAGRGNNGGDAFAAACCLREEDFQVEVLLAGAVQDVRGDALKHLRRMRELEVPLRELPLQEDWADAWNDAQGEGGRIIVDGVLGIGLKGPPRGPMAGAIRYINGLADHGLVVSIDVPSGLDADTGVAAGDCVVADVTATIGLPKIGLLAPSALEYVGGIEVVPIGIPEDLIEALPCGVELMTDVEARRALPRRKRVSHKGHYGHALVAGGSPGYAGAVALAAKSALRSGAGLVSVATPVGLVPLVAAANLEAMTHAVEETAAGGLSAGGWAVWRERLGRFSAVVMGPGMGCCADTAAWVEGALADCEAPLVLDADALNVLSGRLERVAKARGPVILTPHPGEMARLLGCATEEVQADRQGAAHRAAQLSGATVVLKGAGTVIASEGKPLMLNLTGNPGMASGGMGDVLAGIIGGLAAQGISPYEAACTAVYLHGRTGDNLARRKSQRGLAAGDIADELPYTIKELTGR